MARRDSITITVDRRDGVGVVAVAGEVDMVTAPSLQTAVDKFIGDGTSKLIIDLSAVTFMASSGLSILASTPQRLGEAAKFAVVANNPATVRPIQLTNLDQLVSPCSTLDEALAIVGNHNQPKRGQQPEPSAGDDAGDPHET